MGWPLTWSEANDLVNIWIVKNMTSSHKKGLIDTFEANLFKHMIKGHILEQTLPFYAFSAVSWAENKM